MKRSVLLVVLLCAASVLAFAENRSRQEGTIVRMRMAECFGPQHAFMSAMSGAAAPAGEQCPEYVLVTNSVVYVIVGRNSSQLVPLAETTFFQLRNNVILIRIDDAKRESRFHVKEMVLRPEWERNQQLMEAASLAVIHRHLEGGLLVDTRQ